MENYENSKCGIETGSDMTRLEKFKSICHKFLVISDDEYIDVIFGTIFANRLDSKPVWLHIVGPPGGGKTEILQALGNSPEIYSLSSITANTLISGMVTGANKPDPSLLPKLDGKILVIKDFTPLLSGRRETLMEVLGQLRDAYDGTAKKAFGTGKDKEYKSKFGIISGVTGIIDKHQGMLAALGERFLIYRLPQIDSSEERQRCRIACLNTAVKHHEQELRDAAQEVLANRNIAQIEFPEKLREEIIDIAMFTAKARSHVDRDAFTKEPEIPTPEVATRLSKQLSDLAVGIAMAREKTTVTIDEIKIVKKIALDCLPMKRIKLLKCLMKHNQVSKIAEELNFSVSAIQRWLEDLELLGIVKKDSDNSWKLLHSDLLHSIWD